MTPEDAITILVKERHSLAAHVLQDKGRANAFSQNPPGKSREDVLDGPALGDVYNAWQSHQAARVLCLVLTGLKTQCHLNSGSWKEPYQRARLIRIMTLT